MLAIDEGPNLGQAGLRRLPSPTEHAQRGRDAVQRLLDRIATRLLVVASTSGQRVTLAEQDGTLLDEDLPLVGGPSDPRLFAGDKVVRLALPGRGRRDAAPGYVVLGPVNPVRGTPTVQVGPGDGPAAGPGATASVSGTDEFCRVTITTGGGTATGILFTLYWSRTRPGAAYGVAFSGRNVAGRTAVAGGMAQSSADTVKCPVGVAVAPPASSTLIVNVFMRDG